MSVYDGIVGATQGPEWIEAADAKDTRSQLSVTYLHKGPQLLHWALSAVGVKHQGLFWNTSCHLVSSQVAPAPMS